MKTVLICFVVATVIAMVNADAFCLADKDKCAKDDGCCVKRGPITICKPLLQEGDTCEMHPGKMLFPNHVYLVKCPCGSNLKCVAKDGLVGKLLGTCQRDEEEEVEE